jgi:hypothetical protein
MKKMNVDVALQAGWWCTRDTYFHSPEFNDNDSVLPIPKKIPNVLRCG